jgi:biotin carboxyl carrier protein
MKYVSTLADHEYIVEIIDECHVMIDGKVFLVDFNDVIDQPVYSLIIDGKSYEALVYPIEETWEVLLHGHLYSAKVEDERELRLRAASGKNLSSGTEFHLKAPMPGMVVSVAVDEGQEVIRGELLVILESMKMQNELKSPRDGVITRLKVKSGDSVEQHQTLLSVV